MIADSPPSSKHCCVCGHAKPIEEFRRLYSDKDWPRHSDCRECHNGRARTERWRQRFPRLRDRLRQLAAARRVERIDAVLQAMLDEFGGIDGLASAYNDLKSTGRPADRRCAFDGIFALIRWEDAARETEREAHRQIQVDLQDPALQRQAEELGGYRCSCVIPGRLSRT